VDWVAEDDSKTSSVVILVKSVTDLSADGDQHLRLGAVAGRMPKLKSCYKDGHNHQPS